MNYAELSCIVFTLAPTFYLLLDRSLLIITVFMINSEGEHDDDMNLALSLVQIYISRPMIVQLSSSLPPLTYQNGW